MSWLDRLLGRPTPEVKTKRAKDRQALNDLHNSFEAVTERTKRHESEYRRVNEKLEAELRRVNQALRERRQPR